MYHLLLAFLSSHHGTLSSDDIFYYFLRRSYSEHQISGVIGYARSRGILQIVGHKKSTRIKKNVNIYQY
ncbi:MAG: hypothetical protein HFI74_06785 [Lachnospiraceae bacterium]|nr:hypothetical protein [Lachnospiraceae bacterium]